MRAALLILALASVALAQPKVELGEEHFIRAALLAFHTCSLRRRCVAPVFQTCTLSRCARAARISSLAISPKPCRCRGVQNSAVNPRVCAENTGARSAGHPEPPSLALWQRARKSRQNLHLPTRRARMQGSISASVCRWLACAIASACCFALAHSRSWSLVDLTCLSPTG